MSETDKMTMEQMVEMYKEDGTCFEEKIFPLLTKDPMTMMTFMVCKADIDKDRMKGIKDEIETKRKADYDKWEEEHPPKISKEETLNILFAEINKGKNKIHLKLQGLLKDYEEYVPRGVNPHKKTKAKGGPRKPNNNFDADKPNIFNNKGYEWWKEQSVEVLKEKQLPPNNGGKGWECAPCIEKQGKLVANKNGFTSLRRYNTHIKKCGCESAY